MSSRRAVFTATSGVVALLAAASAAHAQAPDAAFTAGGDAAILQADVIDIPDTGSLVGLGVARTATTGTVTTADSSSRNVDGDLGGQDAVDAVLVLESQEQPDTKVGQFLGVPLNQVGGIGVGEGAIVHAAAYDVTAPCPPADGQDYTRSVAQVESVLLGPDVFSPEDEVPGTGDTVQDGPDGGALDNLLDPVNDAVGQITDGLDPVTDTVDTVVDQVFDALGLPVPGGPLVDISSEQGSGIGSTSAVRLVPGSSADRAGVQVQSIADTLSVDAIGGLLQVEVLRPAGLTVTALGTPGSATIDYQAPIARISIAGEERGTLDASENPQTFEIPGLARVTVGELVESSTAEDGTAVAATGATLRLVVLDPLTEGAPIVDLTLGPVTASIADLTPGGLPCNVVQARTPQAQPPAAPQLPVTGGGTAVLALAALGGAALLRRRVTA